MINNNRVLIIKFSPINGLNSSVLRTLALVKGLVTKGYKVDILTLQSSETHVLNNVEYDFLKDVNIVYANPNKVYGAVVSGSNKGPKKIIVNLIRKIYHAFALYDYSGSIAKKISISILPSVEYEYVISVSDPKTSHVATQKLIKQGLKFNKLIEYWGDPLYGDITLKSFYPGFVYKNLERKLLSIADMVVYTSPFTLYEEKNMYPDIASKMAFTPTGYIDKKLYYPNNDKYRIGYYGAYPSNVRDIMPLYNACKMLENEVCLSIVGNSDLILENTNNIEVFPRGDISSFEKKTDLFVCILNKKGTQIPGKLYHYAAYNKPVLVLEAGDDINALHEYICSFGRYYTCSNTRESIIDCIKDIKNKNEQWEPLDKLKPEKIADFFLNL